VVHRALFGSVERFFALLIEHYKGDFPLWFAPLQFGIVPINQSHNEYCKRLEIELKKRGLRAAADYSEIHMREKIKRFEIEKTPYILVVGDRDVEAGGFSVRSRNMNGVSGKNGKRGGPGAMDLESLLAYIKDDLEQGVPKYILD